MKKILTTLVIIAVILCSLNFTSVNLCAEGDYSIRVNRITNCVTIYDNSGTAVKSMVCSVGNTSEGYGTPKGTFNTSEKMRWHSLFGNEYGQYCTRINGHILFHSVPYFSQNPNDLNTENYNMLGEQDSMGCIRLTVADAKWIYDNCPLDTQVTIFDGSSEDDPLGRPEAIKLGSAAPYAKWDPTDPSENNPWQYCSPKIEITNKVRCIYENSYLSGEALDKYMKDSVKAYDTAGNPIDFEVQTNLNPIKAGNYTISYKATDALGRTAVREAEFVVLPSSLIMGVSVK